MITSRMREGAVPYESRPGTAPNGFRPVAGKDYYKTLAASLPTFETLVYSG